MNGVKVDCALRAGSGRQLLVHTHTGCKKVEIIAHLLQRSR